MVKRWYDKSKTFDDAKSKTQFKIAAGRKVFYEDEEAMLFDAVFVRRQLLGLWVDRYWLQDEFYHSPCEWAMPGKYTLNIQGTPCWMWQPGSGLEKRFITILLCIRAEGKQIIKPIVIFRGQGLRISEQEKAALDGLTNIRWYFQPKAWTDGEFCRWFLESFKADLTAANINEEVLLGLDGLPGQRN